jgi:hypothetical protein
LFEAVRREQQTDILGHTAGLWHAGDPDGCRIVTFSAAIGSSGFAADRDICQLIERMGGGGVLLLAAVAWAAGTLRAEWTEWREGERLARTERRPWRRASPPPSAN